jgi:ribosomal protein L29
MSKMKDLKGLSKSELKTKLSELDVELNKFFASPKEKIEKPRQKSNLRHQRARILSLLSLNDKE